LGVQDTLPVMVEEAWAWASALREGTSGSGTAAPAARPAG